MSNSSEFNSRYDTQFSSSYNETESHQNKNEISPYTKSVSEHGYTQYLTSTTTRFQSYQTLFSESNKIHVRDSYGGHLFLAKFKVWSLGLKFSITDNSGEEIHHVKQKVLCRHPRFKIYREGILLAQAERHTSLRDMWYNIKLYTTTDSSTELVTKGDISDYEFGIFQNDIAKAVVSKQFFEEVSNVPYGVEVGPNEDAPFLLCIVLIIDAIHQSETVAVTTAAATTAAVPVSV
eukprot:gb/GECH01003132.1/.p1 GENE.gb/GECH01003132.1/~~gb/GECH01003132.1/.p1  ORF type:complete len:234 (+),score=40.27 gb/GECH01003132.1/:1-702(+)